MTKPLNILILGGTQFIGIHLTELAEQRGHRVTLFNRGRSGAGLFPRTERLTGDRDGQLDALKGRKWDAVIDVSAYIPRHVRLTAELLAPNIGRYLYVSTVSVYADFSKPNTESSAIGKLRDESVEHIDATTYGPLKALGEPVLHDILGERSTIVRPGYVVGAHDYTDRYTHWPMRALRGGEMIAPGAPSDPMQFIDVRDLSRFMLDLLERDTAGIYNAVSPPGAYTIGKVIDASIDAAKTLQASAPDVEPVWIPADFLERQANLSLGKDFPLWHSPSGDKAGFALCDTTAAMKAGLKITPLDITTRDTLAWNLTRPAVELENPKAGISPRSEREVLAAWSAKT